MATLYRSNIGTSGSMCKGSLGFGCKNITAGRGQGNGLNMSAYFRAFRASGLDAKPIPQAEDMDTDTDEIC
jgi:hypothetical protein